MNELVQMFEDYAIEKGLGPRIVYAPGVGFATYHINENECYIEDIYIVPEKRMTSEGTKLANAIAEIAKHCKCKILSGSVNIKANGKITSMKALLAYDMAPSVLSGDMIYFSKEL